MAICETCKKEFIPKRGSKKKYCSYICYWNKNKRHHIFILQNFYASTINNKFVFFDLEGKRLFEKYNWFVSGNGYLMRMDKRKGIYFHRELLNFSSSEIDHINNNKLDNRRSNLRYCSRSQNNYNSLKRTNTRSQYKGIIYEKGINKWRPRIKINKKSISLGCFNSELAAALVYDYHAKKHYKEFAKINFPDYWRGR